MNDKGLMMIGGRRDEGGNENGKLEITRGV